MAKKQKYIFVTGGVLSGVGKGITAASMGAILQAKGLTVSIQKCDPYLNVDAGLLNPREHGECFVTRDGAETDLDLGHYERFLDIELTQANATLSGRLFRQLIDDERAGKFNGQTVQLVPHLTNAIKNSIFEAADDADVHIVEIGGTVGDYESLSFIEAIRDFSRRVDRENCLYVHVVYVPYIQTSKEFKSKPAQNALYELRGFGIEPDCVVVRTDEPAPQSIATKISRFSGVPEEAVVMVPNASTVYQVPLTLHASGIGSVLAKFTGNSNEPDMAKWQSVVNSQLASTRRVVRVGLVAKYLDNEDTYISVIEALKAAAWSEGVGLAIVGLNAEAIDESDLESVDALLVPGGFGARGVEGKIRAADYALTHQKPYLGICLGLQVAVIAAARRSGLTDANSTEFDIEATPVIGLMNGQAGQESTGGTLRLGDYPATLESESKVAQLYGSTDVIERHRHRYEVNPKYLNDVHEGGVIVTGRSPDGKLVEFIEAVDHPYFVATQAHPEFRSRPYRAHPLFSGLIRAALD
ncbi:hypothetical protein B7Y94_02970 [Candidatus Saccharibacteria bacterium 32-49-12]|nr:MAG: hypothetical protein B7Y94_02970 [Candidatus Saccharibacteria bacterium 32-49-12]